jgi:spore germination protein GerM
VKKLFILLFLFCLTLSCTPKKSVTIYFSKMTDTDFYLISVKREVTGRDVYKATLEALIKGPENIDEGFAVLPKTVKILSTEKDEDLLIVDFSKEIILDANQVGVSSSTEALALGSIANTLTEFPEIKRVRILIEGKRNGDIDGREIEDFWGHIGIREDLSRNENLLHN